MKRNIICLCAAALTLITAAFPRAFASVPRACYPVSVVRSEDGTEIRKAYELSPDQDPGGISRSDFEQDGFHYAMADLLCQEAPEYEERQHTETVSLPSKSKDMASVLALLPERREFTTEDGLTGILTLRLETVNVEVAGYSSSTRTVSATRSYSDLSGQDTSYIPKTIEDGGRTLTLESIDWQTDSTTTVDGQALGDRYTAVATYTGTAASRSVSGYTVTADYAGTVSRIILDKVRYVAIFRGTPLIPPEAGPTLGPDAPDSGNTAQPGSFQFNWLAVLLPIGLLAAVGGSIGAALLLKRRREAMDIDLERKDPDDE